jgi:hypothetical protein
VEIKKNIIKIKKKQKKKPNMKKKPKRSTAKK